MFKNFWKDGKKTTILSIITLVLGALVMFGLITAPEKEALQSAIQTLMDAIPGGDFTSIATAVVALLGAIVMLFVKDPDKLPKDETPKGDTPVAKKKNGK